MGGFWLEGYTREIERCIKTYDSFEEGAGFLQSVFKVLKDYDDKNSEKLTSLDCLPLSMDEAAELMRSDNSLRFRPDFDRKLFREIFKIICTETVKVNPSLKNAIRQAVEKTEDFLSGEQATVSLDKLFACRDLVIEETAVENDMATFLFSITMSSIYRRQLESLSKVLRTDLYEGGDCPLCGEKPHYGMLRSEDGAKQLECWLCGTSWLHTRVKCPYCSNEERDELGYFTLEDKEVCRVNYCQSCCLYCKIIDSRKFNNVDGELVLAIHNLASLDHDYLARKEGFLPGSGLEWVNEKELNEIEKED